MTETQPKHTDDQRVRTLEMVVQEMDVQLHHMQAVVQCLAIGTADDKESDQVVAVEGSRAMRDEVWACSNCAARLGIYNDERDELRVRYKDFVAYVRPGVGGNIMVPCRRCGEQNTLSDTRGDTVG